MYSTNTCSNKALSGRHKYDYQEDAPGYYFRYSLPKLNTTQTWMRNELDYYSRKRTTAGFFRHRRKIRIKEQSKRWGLPTDQNRVRKKGRVCCLLRIQSKGRAHQTRS